MRFPLLTRDGVESALAQCLPRSRSSRAHAEVLVDKKGKSETSWMKLVGRTMSENREQSTVQDYQQEFYPLNEDGTRSTPLASGTQDVQNVSVATASTSTANGKEVRTNCQTMHSPPAEVECRLLARCTDGMADRQS